MKNFDDLNFTYDESMRRWMASLTLDNGYSFSVIAGKNEDYNPFYGRYPDTFEVAVFNPDSSWVPLGAHDDVLGWQDRNQVSSLIRQFEMDGQAHENLLVAMREEKKKELA